MNYLLAIMAKICAVAEDESLSVKFVDAEISFDAGKVLPINTHVAVLLLVMAVENVILKTFLKAPPSDGNIKVTVEINSPTHICYWSYRIDYADFCYKWPNAFLDGLIARKPIIEKQLTDALTAMLEAHVNMTAQKAGDGYVIHCRN